MTSYAVNPSVITPVTQTGSVGVLPEISPPVVLTSTAAPPPTPAPPAITQQATIIQTPESAPSITVQPAPAFTIPDISQMETQLQTSGALVSDIPEQPLVDTSPLAHLQPNVVQPPAAAISNSALTTPLAPIRLASTAPAAIPVPANPVANYQVSESGGMGKTLIKIVVGGLTGLMILTFGLMLYQQHPEMFKLGTQTTGSPTFEVAPTTEDSKAVWYQ